MRVGFGKLCKRHQRWLTAFVVFPTALSALASSAAALPAPGLIESVVGSGVADGRSAAVALIDPRGVAAQPAASGAANLYIADGLNHRLRYVSAASGLISTLAGTGQAGFGGDNGPATTALLRFPTEVVVDQNGSIYVADSDNNRVRRITPDGIITTLAGNGSVGSSGDGGPATQAALSSPRGLALDTQGNLYVAEFTGTRVRKIGTNGIISTIAGSGTWGSGGDGGLAVNARLANPSGVAVDAVGNVYIADYQNSRIRRVNPDGIISTIAGDGFQGFRGDGGPAQWARLRLPYRVRFDVNGNLIVLDQGNNRVRRIQAVNGVVTGAGSIETIAGNGEIGSSGDGGAAIGASLLNLNGLAVDSSNRVYVGVTSNQLSSPGNRVRVISASGIISSQVGGSNGDGGPAVDAVIDPRGSASGGAAAPQLLYVADGANHRVRLIDLNTNIISSIAGTGTAGWAGDGGPAINAQLKSPFDVVRDASGNVWIADTLNNRIRRVAANGTISTVVGTGAYAYSGDGGSPLAASLAYPYGLALDATATTLYIADLANSRIRKVTNNVITTVAGNGTWGSGGDGGPATSASLASPTDVAIGPDGLLYIADYNNNVIRRVRADGIIERVAGTALAGFSGDGGPALAAQLSLPSSMAFDSDRNLLIGDAQNKRIRRVNAATGIITTIAGTGIGGTEGDGGLAVAANLYRSSGLSVDPYNHLFISQSDSYRIRVTTLADSEPACANRISGSIRYFSNLQPVNDVVLTLDATDGQANDRVGRSDAGGVYTIDNACDGTSTLTPIRDETASRAVTAIDASYVLQAAVGLRSLSATQRIACDANGSGSITAIDASIILQLRVGLISELPVARICGADWAFLPGTSPSPPDSFTPLTITNGECTPGSLLYNPLHADKVAQDFTALLFGDCNGSWPSAEIAARRWSAKSELKLGRARGWPGVVSIPVLLDATARVRGLELTLEYDPSRLSSPVVHRGRGAGSSLMQTNPSSAGRLRIALASRRGFSSGTLLRIRFFGDASRSLRGAVHLVDAILDGE